MGTTVTYGSIILENVLTRAWSQEFVYDESRQNVVSVRTLATWEVILHKRADQTVNDARTGAKIGSTFPATDPPAAWGSLIAALREPRQNLTVQIGGAVMFQCEKTGDDLTLQNRDVANGPLPQHVSITNIAGSKCFRLTFTIECNKLECSEAGPPPVSSNHFTVQEEMDLDFYTTRRVHGQIKFTGANVPAAAYKPLVMYPLEKEFRRESVDFTVAADGLSASYSIVDRQIYTAAPFPATQVSGSHTEELQNGVLLTARCNIQLTGGPRTTPADLLVLIVRMMNARLRWYGDPYAVVTGSVFTTHFGDKNVVDGSMSIIRNPVNPTQVFNIAGIGKNLGQPLAGTPFTLQANGRYYQQDDTTPPSAYGYTHSKERDAALFFLLQAANLPPDTTCAGANVLENPASPQPTSSKGKGTEEESTGTSVSMIVVDSLPPLNTDLYSEPDAPAVYTLYSVDAKYVTRKGKVQMPLAAPPEEEDGDTCVVVKIGQPQCYRIITIDSERIGAWPKLPEPIEENRDENGIYNELMDFRHTSHPPTPTPDGQALVYHIRASYLYSLSRPPRADEVLAIGPVPYTSLSQLDESIPSEDVFSL